MSARSEPRKLEQPLPLIAAGVCTQAGDADFASFAAVALKMLGAVPDPLVLVPASNGQGELPVLKAGIEETVVPSELNAAQRMVVLLHDALRALLRELPADSLGVDTLVQVMLPATHTARGEDVDPAFIQASLVELLPDYEACRWRFSSDDNGALPGLDALIAEDDARVKIFAGVDSLVTAVTCMELARTGRVMTVGGDQGLVPGEAAAAVALAANDVQAKRRAWLASWASEPEPAVGKAYSQGLNGLRTAIERALCAAGLAPGAVASVWHTLGAEITGELEWFQVQRRLWPAATGLPAPQTLRLFHAFGEVGAATLPLQLALASASFDYARSMHRFGFPAPGPVLVCETGDAPMRGALCLLPEPSAARSD